MSINTSILCGDNEFIYTDALMITPNDINKRKTMGSYSDRLERIEMKALKMISRKSDSYDSITVYDAATPINSYTLETLCDKIIEYGLDEDKLLFHTSTNLELAPFNVSNLTKAQKNIDSLLNALEEHKNTNKDDTFYSLNYAKTIQNINKYVTLGYYKSRTLEHRKQMHKKAIENAVAMLPETIDIIGRSLLELLSNYSSFFDEYAFIIDEIPLYMEVEESINEIKQTNNINRLISVIHDIKTRIRGSKFELKENESNKETYETVRRTLSTLERWAVDTELKTRVGGTIISRGLKVNIKEDIEDISTRMMHHKYKVVKDSKRFNIVIREGISCDKIANYLDENKYYCAIIRIPFINIHKVKLNASSKLLNLGISSIFFDDELDVSEIRYSKRIIVNTYTSLLQTVSENVFVETLKKIEILIKTLYDNGIYIREYCDWAGFHITVSNEISFDALCNIIVTTLKELDMYELLYDIVKLETNEIFKLFRQYNNYEKYIPENNNFWRTVFGK